MEVPRPGHGWDALYQRLQIAAERIAPDRHVMWTPTDLPDRLVVAFRDRAELRQFEAWLEEKCVLTETGSTEMYEAVVEIPPVLVDDPRCLEQLHAIARSISFGRYLMAKSGPDTVFGFVALSDSKAFRRRLDQLQEQMDSPAA